MNNAMTNEEICRDYRLAKQKVKQIGILADLNECTRKEIVEILKASGEELPYIYQSHTQPRKRTTASLQEAPEQMPTAAVPEDELVSGSDSLPVKFAEVSMNCIAKMTDDFAETEDADFRFRCTVEGIIRLWRDVVRRGGK